MVGIIIKNSAKNPRPRPPQTTPRRTGPAPTVKGPQEVWERKHLEKCGDLEAVELTDPQTGFKTVHIKDDNPKQNEREKAAHIQNLVGKNPGRSYENGIAVGILKREE